MINHSKPTIETDDFHVVRDQLNSNMLSKGLKTKELENRLKSFLNVGFAETTSSGKSALILGLLSLDLSKDDEIIIPAYVCRTVYDAIRFLRLKPVIVDIGDDYNIDPIEVEKHLTHRTKAVIVVHIFGISAEIDKIFSIVKKYDNNIVVIEDIAQAIGGKYKNKKLGSWGDLAFGSFHTTKMLAGGEGGFLLINNLKLIHKFEEKKNEINFGSNFSDFSASLAINQLKKLNKFIEIRKNLAQRYIHQLKNLEQVYIPFTDFKLNIFFRFPVRITKAFDFDSLKIKMEEQGIQIRKGVDLMLHQIDTKFYCPRADQLFNQTVSLPIYPSLTDEDLNLITFSLKECL